MVIIIISCTYVCTLISLHTCLTALRFIHILQDACFFLKAAGSSGDCWGKSGASLVTISTQPTKNFILAGMVETDDCGNKAPYVTHTKLDGFQQWITENLHT